MPFSESTLINGRLSDVKLPIYNRNEVPILYCLADMFDTPRFYNINDTNQFCKFTCANLTKFIRVNMDRVRFLREDDVVKKHIESLIFDLVQACKKEYTPNSNDHVIWNDLRQRMLQIPFAQYIDKIQPSVDSEMYKILHGLKTYVFRMFGITPKTEPTYSHYVSASAMKDFTVHSDSASAMGSVLPATASAMKDFTVPSDSASAMGSVLPATASAMESDSPHNFGVGFGRSKPSGGKRKTKKRSKRKSTKSRK